MQLLRHLSFFNRYARYSKENNEHEYKGNILRLNTILEHTIQDQLEFKEALKAGEFDWLFEKLARKDQRLTPKERIHYEITIASCVILLHEDFHGYLTTDEIVEHLKCAKRTAEAVISGLKVTLYGAKPHKDSADFDIKSVSQLILLLRNGYKSRHGCYACDRRYRCAGQ